MRQLSDAAMEDADVAATESVVEADAAWVRWVGVDDVVNSAGYNDWGDFSLPQNVNHIVVRRPREQMGVYSVEMLAVHVGCWYYYTVREKRQ